MYVFTWCGKEEKSLFLQAKMMCHVYCLKLNKNLVQAAEVFHGFINRHKNIKFIK